MPRGAAGWPNLELPRRGSVEPAGRSGRSARHRGARGRHHGPRTERQHCRGCDSLHIRTRRCDTDDDDSGLQACTIFKYYLERHIELDGDDQGALAIALVERLCGVDTKNESARANWMQAEKAVKHAFEMRVALWDAVCLLATSPSIERDVSSP